MPNEYISSYSEQEPKVNQVLKMHRVKNGDKFDLKIEHLKSGQTFTLAHDEVNEILRDVSDWVNLNKPLDKKPIFPGELLYQKLWDRSKRMIEEEIQLIIKSKLDGEITSEQMIQVLGNAEYTFSKYYDWDGYEPGTFTKLTHAVYREDLTDDEFEQICTMVQQRYGE